MLERSGRFLEKGSYPQRVLAAAIRRFLRGGGKDIPFPDPGQDPNLEKAIKEYHNSLLPTERQIQSGDGILAKMRRRLRKE